MYSAAGQNHSDYGRSGRTKGKAASSVLPPVLSVKAGLDGSFTLPNLAPGGWLVCAEASKPPSVKGVSGTRKPAVWSTFMKKDCMATRTSKILMSVERVA